MILGLIEHDQGEVNKLTYEMLTAARNLAAELDMPLGAVLVGDDVYDMAEELAEYGVTQAWIVEDDAMENYAPAAWAQAMVEVINEQSPVAAMAIGTDRGNEVMAHVGAKLGAEMCANVLEITTGDAYFVTRVRWGGSLLEEANVAGTTKLMTVAPLVTTASTVETDEDVEVNELDIAFSASDMVVRLVAREVPEQAGVSLSDARIVVSGGRGVGSAEGFNSLITLADEVEGAVGCSRAVTNNGWRPHADQVGQTGNRVAPDLYIACGISGASQHMAGCAASKKILVVNTDSEAPILARADYAVIGDLHEVIPAIAAEVKKLKRQRR